MTYFNNIKAQYYLATFFNGDMILYDGRQGKKNHDEVIKVSKLHDDKI